MEKLNKQFLSVQFYAEEFIDDGGNTERADLIRAALYRKEGRDTDEIGKKTSEAITIIEGYCLEAIRETQPLVIEKPSKKFSSPTKK